MRKMIILRGVSGCGKSTVADEITAPVRNSVICLADKYFMVNDEYKFNPEKIGEAHAFCRGMVRAAVEINASMIVIDNTNTMKWEYQPYLSIAEDHGYEVEEIVVGKFDDESLKVYAERNSHGVPLQAIKKMAERFE